VLPEAFRGIRPDAIAVGKEPRLLVEIISGDRQSSEKIEMVRELVARNPGWKLHVVYIGRESPNELSPLPLVEIRRTIDQISSVASKDTRAGLMMCWASLEALARALQPGTFPKPQTPGRIVEQLAGIAYVTASVAEFLRSMGRKRNEFVHGQLRTEIDSKDIDNFLAILRSLVEEAQAEHVP
jgi:hypothetical protein